MFSDLVPTRQFAEPYSCPVRMALLVSVVWILVCLRVCFGVLGGHRPWKRLTGFKSSLGMSFSCYFISVLFSAFSACKRQGRLPGFRAVQEIWWYRSVSVYTLWLSCTPASLSPWSIWLLGMECRHLPADIQLVSTLLLDIFRQKEDDSPCLSCLTGTLYGWKRLN